MMLVMGERQVRVLTCDAAGCEVAGDAVERFTLLHHDHEYEFDLCHEHSRPLRDLMSHALPKTRRATGRDRVWTMDEIEALKRGLN